MVRQRPGELVRPTTTAAGLFHRAESGHCGLGRRPRRGFLWRASAPSPPWLLEAPLTFGISAFPCRGVCVCVSCGQLLKFPPHLKVQRMVLLGTGLGFRIARRVMYLGAATVPDLDAIFSGTRLVPDPTLAKRTSRLPQVRQARGSTPTRCSPRAISTFWCPSARSRRTCSAPRPPLRLRCWPPQGGPSPRMHSRTTPRPSYGRASSPRCGSLPPQLSGSRSRTRRFIQHTVLSLDRDIAAGACVGCVVPHLRTADIHPLDLVITHACDGSLLTCPPLPEPSAVVQIPFWA